MQMLFSCNHAYILFNNFVIIFRLLHLSSLVPKYFCFLNCTKITVRQSRVVCDPPLLKWTISSERARLWTASFMQLRFCTYWWPCLELLQVDTYWLPGISTFFCVWRDLPVSLQKLQMSGTGTCSPFSLAAMAWTHDSGSANQHSKN